MRASRCWLLMVGVAMVAPWVGPRAARAREYQFGVELERAADPEVLNGSMPAFLWVPPEAPKIRGVIIAAANVIERRFCDDPIIREEATRDGLAIVFIQGNWVKGTPETPKLAELMEILLTRLAEVSGYGELKTVPWIPVGHSGNSAFCAALGRDKPERTLANIVIKGALPNPAKDGSTAGLVGIPILFVTGEFEEVMPPGKVRDAWWGVQMKRFAVAKAAVPQALINGMEDRSHGHLNWFPDLSRYAAMFIHKAVAARLGDDGGLRKVAFEGGWLTDPELKAPAAPVEKYTGDRAAAFWHFDGEQAKAWAALYGKDRGKKEQLLAFTQDGAVAPWWNGWALQGLKFEPLEDGVSFTASAAFRDEVPAPFADAGKKVGHSDKGPIQFQMLGWASQMEQTGTNTFRVAFDREGVNGRTVHVLLGAYHPGDAEYRETVAVASFDVPYSNPEGGKQTIHFPQIPDVKAGTASIPLQATTTAGEPMNSGTGTGAGAAEQPGLKPEYYISWGPAEVAGDRIRFTPLPLRAKYPVEVKITAYQWGKATDPKYATATPVTQVFHLVK